MSYCPTMFSERKINAQIIWGLGFLLVYLAICFFFLGLRSDHINLIIFTAVLIVSSSLTRDLAFSMVFFILYWMIYDSMRLVPNYMVNEVSTYGLYSLEKSIFGIFEGGKIFTPNEYLNIHHSSILDISSGIFYLFWVPLPMALSVYLFFKDKEKLIIFSFVFLFVNLVGFIFYYVFPAAPPWYIASHGFDIDYNVAGSPANLIYFDKLTGLPIFEKMYSRNANVFAAIPSLHAAYPIIAAYYSVKYKLRYFAIFSIIVTLGIWFSAVYSMHHYVIDVLLGILCAFTGILIFEKLLSKTILKEYLIKYANYIDQQNPNF